MKTPIQKRASGKSAQFKAEPLEAGEGGIHGHTLDRAALTTGNDGAHQHLFVLPDGTLIATEEDGAHAHSLHDGADVEVWDGQHTHRLFLEDGTELVTSSDCSHHWHQLQVVTTAMDGAHTHVLDIPGQGSIRSLTPGEFWERMHGPATASAESVTQDAAERPVHVYRRVKDGNVSTDLAIAGDKIIEMATAKQGGADPSGRDLVRTYSVDGDRFAKSLCTPAKVEFRFPSDDIEGVSVPVDKGTVDIGIAQSDFYEYFISKSGRTNGVLLVSKNDKGVWAGCLSTESLLPMILTATAVRKKWMPAPGKSAMPASLEAVVPDDLRFWELEKAEDARATRDALVESRFFTEDNIRVVNGSISRVVHKMFLYNKPGEASTPTKKYAKRTLPETIAPITGARKVASSIATADSPDGWPLWVRDCAKIAAEQSAVLHITQPVCETQSGATITAELAKLSQDFVVALLDTPANRGELHKLGAPFKLRYGDQRWVYAASFPVAKRADCDWLAIAETAEELGLPDRVVKTIMPDGDVEERFVLGIVLEPEVVDAQNDIYSEGEVRSSAHKFMENFQNMGLMHQALVNNGVRILESFITPVDMTIAEVAVKKGTWLLAVRVMDDGLWLAVKEGDLTGFSIGGSAIRVPD